MAWIITAGITAQLILCAIRKSWQVGSVCEHSIYKVFWGGDNMPVYLKVLNLYIHLRWSVLLFFDQTDMLKQRIPVYAYAWHNQRLAVCVYVRHSCVNVIGLNNTYASVFSPVDRVAAPRFGLSSGHRALHGHDRWNQKRCKAITEDREEGLGRSEGAELS